MGKITPARPVKLITGFIFKDKKAFVKARGILIKHFGNIDFESRMMPFTLTDYYREEFGSGLKRVFISFRKLIQPQQIAAVKILTNKIEKRLTCANKRTVNLDPGYLDTAKLVLASTKDYVHRIYLGKGIYAEITLFYQAKTFSPWQWTYPDYRTGDYIGIFNHIREIYTGQVKK
ncbi:MAG: DUF4416 family protein [Candidatus Omnitrophica bacterium]|nr:DUF4416 family protein [Candidatus Omnitrophota bacterium]